MDDHCVPLSQTINRLADWVDPVLLTWFMWLLVEEDAFSNLFFIVVTVADSLMTVCLKQLGFAKDNQSTQHTGLLCLS